MLTTTRRKFTIDEYHQLVNLVFFTENDKIKLIRGEIAETALKRTPHSVCSSILFGELYKLLSERAIIRGQEPTTFPSNSEPEIDVVIAKKKANNYHSAHPRVEDIILVIEIFDSTLQYDCETKLFLYAEARINNYWIFNLVDSRVEVYSNPFANNYGKFDYRNKSIILLDESIAIPNFSNVFIDLRKTVLA